VFCLRKVFIMVWDTCIMLEMEDLMMKNMKHEISSSSRLNRLKHVDTQQPIAQWHAIVCVLKPDTQVERHSVPMHSFVERINGHVGSNIACIFILVVSITIRNARLPSILWGEYTQLSRAFEFHLVLIDFLNLQAPKFLCFYNCQSHTKHHLYWNPPPLAC
jgi:hypothetical protein